MMLLYFMDSEAEKPIAGRVELDYDYQAEEWVRKVATGKTPNRSAHSIITFILLDSAGVRCVWTRSVEEAKESKIPELTRVTTRFGGTWEHESTTVDQIDPDDYERAALNHRDSR